MKKYTIYLVRVALVVFVGAIALSPLFTNLAELEEIVLTPYGYIPAVFNAADTPTPSVTPTPAGTATPTPTSTMPAPANLRITFIEYDPPGNDVPGEYIEVTNLGGTAQDIKNWYIAPTTFAGNGEAVLHDPFVFPAYILNPGSTVRVWTKFGINSPPNYYWNATTEIWLNTGDVAKLYDNNNTLIHSCNYAGGGQNTNCGN